MPCSLYDSQNLILVTDTCSFHWFREEKKNQRVGTVIIAFITISQIFTKDLFFFQVLLDLASLIFEEQQSLEVILKKIAATIISFMQVQRCTIFIVDEDCTVSTFPLLKGRSAGKSLGAVLASLPSNSIAFQTHFLPCPCFYGIQSGQVLISDD